MPRRVGPDVSLWLVFFVNGAVLSSWAPRIPAVSESLGIHDGELGIALFGVAAGSVPSLLLTGFLLRRMSARAVCRFSGITFAAALPLIPLAANTAELTAALVVLGAASGALDVAMNTAAVHREQALFPRRILSRLHGGYSLGVLAGAFGGTLAVAAGTPVLTHFLLVSAVLMGLMVVAWPTAPAGPSTATDQTDRPSPTPVVGPLSRRPRMPVPVTILFFAIGALFLEGTVTDWSALLVSRDFGGGTTVGAAAVTVFSTAMALSRTWGDQLAGALGVRGLAMAGSALAGAALTVGASCTDSLVFLLTVAVAGLGLGPQFPLAVGMAGRAAPDDVGLATAAVTAVGYLAYLGGPPLIGLGGSQLGLPVTITVAAATAGTVMTITARRGFAPPPYSSPKRRLPASRTDSSRFLDTTEVLRDRARRRVGSS